MTTCKRCGQPGFTAGVYFVVSDAKTGACLATYDVCEPCMDQYSPLIIPAEVLQAGVAEVRVSYSAFGNSKFRAR